MNKHIRLSILFLFIFIQLNAQTRISNSLNTFMFESDNAYWSSKISNTINLTAFFKAVKINPEQYKSKERLNLSVVIDKSGSMSGDKLNKTKEAVIHLVKLLHPDDIISIVAYDDKVETLIEPTSVNDKDRIIRKIKTIQDNGSTNLSGGMERGYELIKKNSNKKNNKTYINRVILLSDGMANQGITDTQTLKRMVAEFVTVDNISITTMGLGADYNEDLMTGLAVNGTGNYYFIKEASDIEQIFKNELDGILQVASKKTEFVITFPSDKVSIRQVHTYNYTIENGNTIHINLNDIFTAQEKVFFIEFDILNGYEGDVELRGTLSYINALDNDLQVTEEKTYTIKHTTDKSVYSKNALHFGTLTKTLVIVTNKNQQAADAVEARKFNEAESLVETGLTSIKEFNDFFPKHHNLEDLKVEFKKFKSEIKELQKKPKNNRGFKLAIKNARYRSYHHSSNAEDHWK